MHEDVLINTSQHVKTLASTLYLNQSVCWQLQPEPELKLPNAILK